MPTPEVDTRKKPDLPPEDDSPAAEEIVVSEEETVAVGDPWKMKYHPLELPANTVAAQAFLAANADAVDDTIPMSDERMAAALDTISEYGTEDDPRLAGAPTPQALRAGEEEPAYEDSTVAELKDELAARNLPVSGHKEDLVARLEEADTEEKK